MGFKVHGKICDREVVVLIGTAATHNFISKELVVELQIPVERTRSYRVHCGIVGSEDKGAVVCNNVVVKTHGIQIIQRFFPIKLLTADVVLGSEWLKCLGTFAIFGGPTMLMSLEWLGQRVTLQSDPSLTKGFEIGIAMLQWDDDDETSCNKEEKEE